MTEPAVAPPGERPPADVRRIQQRLVDAGCTLRPDGGPLRLNAPARDVLVEELRGHRTVAAAMFAIDALARARRPDATVAAAAATAARRTRSARVRAAAVSLLARSATVENRADLEALGDLPSLLDDRVLLDRALERLDRPTQAPRSRPAGGAASAVERLRGPAAAPRPAPKPRTAAARMAIAEPFAEPEVEVETQASTSTIPAPAEGPVPQVEATRAPAVGAVEPITIRGALGHYVALSFRTRSRGLASLGTLALAVSLLGLWSGSRPGLPLLIVSLVCYLAAAVTYRRGRRD